MKIGNILKYLEDWAPPEVSWERDNVGVQVGSIDEEVRKIFVCLDLTEKSLRAAIKENCNLIITHHPLIFKPLKSIETTKDPKAKIIQTLIKHDITVFSAHTNLDFTKGGVSFVLAEKLGLQNLSFLKNLEGNQFKMVVFVPEENANKVLDAIFNAGGGIIGEYEKCSFTLNGKGTFEGSENSNPAVGIKQNFETVDEVRLEVLIDEWKLNKVISQMIKAHPYEEPAFDIYPLKNQNVNYGYGAVGELQKSYSHSEFLKLVSSKLGTKDLRYTSGSKKRIKRVAVCGGSGSDLVGTAISAGADAFVTADVKYHTFQDAENNILLIDAGHYETENHTMKIVKEKIEDYILQKGEKIKVVAFSGSTNPIKFFNNRGETN